MHLLYYWRPDNYRRDLDFGASFHLNQSSERLHLIEPGESLWAFTRSRSGFYVLAAELVCKAKTFNKPNFRYGAHRIWGDVERSRYFETEHQPDTEQVIRSLSVTPKATILAQSFQGHAAVRPITPQDHAMLTVIAAELQEEPRARILPEERLEAALVYGDVEAVRDLVAQGHPGVSMSSHLCK